MEVSAHKSKFLSAQLREQFVLPARLSYPGYEEMDANGVNELYLSAGMFSFRLPGYYVPGAFVLLGEESSTPIRIQSNNKNKLKTFFFLIKNVVSIAAALEQVPGKTLVDPSSFPISFLPH